MTRIWDAATAERYDTPGTGMFAPEVLEAGYLLIDTYDVLDQQVVSHHVRFDDSTQATVFRSPHRYIWPAELDLMAQLAGLELERRDADWSGSPFTADSPSHVSVYRRPT
ncbi:hypothetical protein [Cellulomonas sp. URHD0024]|uniref:hypothetical protein n=1 Tax=Cellulomonas sp. URHD0024 TaxID=1302620 RepID=UPI0003F824BF